MCEAKGRQLVKVDRVATVKVDRVTAVKVDQVASSVGDGDLSQVAEKVIGMRPGEYEANYPVLSASPKAMDIVRKGELKITALIDMYC